MVALPIAPVDLAIVIILITLSNILLLTNYGISLSFFLFFGLLMTVRPIYGVLIVIPVTFINMILTTSPTPIDFMLVKGEVKGVILQSFFLVIAAFIIAAISLIGGVSAILSNLIFYYMLIFLIYIAITYTLYALAEGVPVTHLAIRGLIQTLVNYWLITSFGARYLAFLKGG